MLDRLVVVDYIEGAGGEYLSQSINSHAEFDNSMVLQKWFNSQRHIIHNWDIEFVEQAHLFLAQCTQQQVKNLAISYHLYFHPGHIELLKPLSKHTQFITIDSTGHEQMVKMEFIRKVLFNSISKQKIKEVKYRVQADRGPQAYKLIELLMQEKLYGIDLVLYKWGLPITRENRENAFNQLLNKKEKCPTNDITILYKDFFVSFDKTEKSYYNLCESLNITPSSEILNAMLVRNKANFKELTEFTKNFESIKNHVLSTTP